ncbi:MAG: SdpI family protein [bacterium]|nr:SdpI family protein [bacterium]
MPLVLAVVYAFYLLIPYIDPLGANIASFRKYYDAFWVLTSAFLLYVYALLLAWNLGYYFNWMHFMLPAVAVLWFALGILLEKSKRNWFIGIRTPWTLSSDMVWKKTHKLAGVLFKIAAGLALIGLLVPFTEVIVYTVVAPAVAIALVTVVYSFILYRQEQIREGNAKSET